MASARRGPRLGPYNKISIASAVSSFLLVRKAPQYAFSSSLFWTTCSIWLGLLLGYWLYCIFLYPLLLSPIRHLPKPEGGSFFMGQWFSIIRNPTGQPMREWVQTVPNNGIIRYLGLFNAERILLASPKALSEVLVSHSYDYVKPSPVFKALSRLTGVGVLLAEGDVHRFQRKHLTPAFSFRHVKELYPVFWAKAIEMTDTIARDVETTPETIELTTAREKANTAFFESEVSSDIYQNEEVALTKSSPSIMEISTYASRATLDIIGVAGMGYDFNTLKNPNTPLALNYQKIFETSTAEIVINILTLILPFWLVKKLPLQRNRDLNSATKQIRQTCLELIARKRADKENDEKHGSGAVDAHDILSTAIDSGAFSDENLVDQIMTFLGAGHETTATSLTWAAYHLSLYPELQARIRAEVRRELPSPSGDITSAPTSNKLDSLPILNAFCNEVLRYYAPVPLTFRTSQEDTMICGERIPARTLIMVCPAAINRSKDLWGPTADKFDIERWLQPNQGGSGGAKTNYANLTFLHGPRSCIGKDFAKGEFLALVAVLVGRLDLRAVEPEKRMMFKGVTSKPEGGVTVAVRKIEGW